MFYVQSCSQIFTRFPLKNNIFSKFEFLNPPVVKNGSVNSLTEIALRFPNLIKENELQSLDNEWRHLRNTEIEFDDNVILFWKQIKNIKYGNEEYTFPILSRFVFDLLTLPHSSANVERVFSAINLMKTKQRNKLNSSSISGLLNTKQLINRDTCFTFPVPNNCLTLTNFNNAMYVNVDDETAD